MFSQDLGFMGLKNTGLELAHLQNIVFIKYWLGQEIKIDSTSFFPSLVACMTLLDSSTNSPENNFLFN